MPSSHTPASKSPPIDQTRETTALLLRRAGFAPTLLEVDAAVHAGLHATVSRLVDYEQISDTVIPPPNLASFADKGANVYLELNTLTIWWLQRMINAARPLQEKMTLFWHGHFATGISKVRSALLMYRQNETFRQNALGRFDDLLAAMYKDPAMLIWLDGWRNTRAAPNENWGREVMELFVLGHGNYTEDDVHAMSRAFTGWRLDPNGNPIFVPRLFDPGIKTILGQTGAWGADDAVRIMAAHPATGPFLATKLWRFFASDEPPQSAISELASVYYLSNHSIREMVRTLFSVPEFYSSDTRFGHIKSPTEFVVGAIRQLQLQELDLTSVPFTLSGLGQQLFNPSNVGGWPGGVTWINAATMLGRFNFASWLTDLSYRPLNVFNPDTFMTNSGAQDMGEAVSAVTDRLGIMPTSSTRMALARFAGRGTTDSAAFEDKIRGLVQLAIVSPEYQVA